MEKKYKKGDLRVWHIPQVPMEAFKIDVKNIEEAKLILNTLANYDAFEFENNIKPDYSNTQGLEVFENDEWSEYCDEDGRDVDEIMERNI